MHGLPKASKAGDDTGFRHYWELCVILALRDGLRSGDIFVPGSRRYANPSTYLYTPGQWMPRQAEYCRLVVLGYPGDYRVGQHGQAPRLLGLAGQQRLADGALLGIMQVAAQRVQAIALVELPGDLAALGRIGQVPISGVDRAAQRAPFLQRGRQGVLAGRTPTTCRRSGRRWPAVLQ